MRRSIVIADGHAIDDYVRKLLPEEISLDEFWRRVGKDIAPKRVVPVRGLLDLSMDEVLQLRPTPMYTLRLKEIYNFYREVEDLKQDTMWCEIGGPGYPATPLEERVRLCGCHVSQTCLCQEKDFAGPIPAEVMSLFDRYLNAGTPYCRACDAVFICTRDYLEHIARSTEHRENTAYCLHPLTGGWEMTQLISRYYAQCLVRDTLALSVEECTDFRWHSNPDEDWMLEPLTAPNTTAVDTIAFMDKHTTDHPCTPCDRVWRAYRDFISQAIPQIIVLRMLFRVHPCHPGHHTMKVVYDHMPILKRDWKRRFPEYLTPPRAFSTLSEEEKANLRPHPNYFLEYNFLHRDHFLRYGVSAVRREKAFLDKSRLPPCTQFDSCTLVEDEIDEERVWVMQHEIPREGLYMSIDRELSMGMPSCMACEMVFGDARDFYIHCHRTEHWETLFSWNSKYSTFMQNLSAFVVSHKYEYLSEYLKRMYPLEDITVQDLLDESKRIREKKAKDEAEEVEALVRDLEDVKVVTPQAGKTKKKKKKGKK